METIQITDTIPAIPGNHPGKPSEFKLKGYIFTQREATKPFTSCVSGKLINSGMRYYSVVLGSGGMSWIAHPDRILLDEMDQYLMKWGNVYGKY